MIWASSSDATALVLLRRAAEAPGPGTVLMGFLFLCLGAAFGAPARYLTDRAIQARHDTVVPWGTMTVNVVGSMILGLLAGLAERTRSRTR